MGRKRKFGEESDFVSVRVPKSKRKEYRIAIRKFVEKKFSYEANTTDINSANKINQKELDGFRKFEEFVEEIKKEEKKEKI